MGEHCWPHYGRTLTRPNPHSSEQAGEHCAAGDGRFPRPCIRRSWHWGKLVRAGSTEKAIEKALRLCRSRALATDPETAVLCHGDAHSGNLLQVLPADGQTQCRFKLIDPDGIICEPAYDLCEFSPESGPPVFGAFGRDDTQAMPLREQCRQQQDNGKRQPHNAQPDRSDREYR